MELEAILPGSQLEILFQLLVAMALGMAMGAERSIAQKTAGMRTYALVSMGSALFVILSTLVTSAYIGISAFDPLRVTAAVIVGIGFLGAGLIIFRGSTLQGLTTAAGMWVTAGVGMAVGFKLYLIAIFTTILTLFVFTAMWVIENFVEKHINFFPDNGKHEATPHESERSEESQTTD